MDHHWCSCEISWTGGVSSRLSHVWSYRYSGLSHVRQVVSFTSHVCYFSMTKNSPHKYLIFQEQSPKLMESLGCHPDGLVATTWPTYVALVIWRVVRGANCYFSQGWCQLLNGAFIFTHISLTAWLFPSPCTVGLVSICSCYYMTENLYLCHMVTTNPSPWELSNYLHRRAMTKAARGALSYFSPWDVLKQKETNTLSSLWYVCNHFFFLSFDSFRINAVSNGQVRGDSYSEGCMGQTGALPQFEAVNNTHAVKRP